MRWCVGESMCDLSHYVPVARAADELGFASFSLGDSICYPEVAVGKYPYTADGDRSFLENAPMPDPFQMIAAMAAVTEQLRFKIGVLKLPIRRPVLVAKQVTSLAVLTNERLTLGVGLSPWIEDFQVTGEDWKSRGKRMDEMIEILRGLMGGGYFEYHGKYYDFARIKLTPVPREPVPILIGAHSDPGLRRAARLADGFTFAGGTLADTLATIDKLHAFRREYDRHNEPFEIHAGVSDLKGPDDIKRLEDAGVTELGTGYRNPYEPDTMTIEQKVGALRQLADRLFG